MERDEREKRNKIIVLNLTDRVEKAHLEEIFNAYGVVTYVDFIPGRGISK